MATAQVMEKDRHSRMLYSTVNAPAKKGGAGGAFTWGSAMDPAAMAYSPVGEAMAAPKIAVAAGPAPVVYTTMQQVPMNYNLRDQGAFPALVAGPRPPAPAVWGPPAVQTPSIIEPEVILRAGSHELFDSSHPRNAFAKKVRVSQVMADKRTPAASIDWSSEGLSGMHQQLVKAVAANPAHLSIYQQAVTSSQPSVQVLRQTPQTFVQYSEPKIGTHNVKPTFVKPHMTQARAR